MECTDLSKYNISLNPNRKVLQPRRVLNDDLLDLPNQIANKFIRKYCDCGLSLCLYEPSSEKKSFYAFLLIKRESVSEDSDAQTHISMYNDERNELWTKILESEGRQIKEFIVSNEIHQYALCKFCQFINTCLDEDNSIYYWIKLDETQYNIPFIKYILEANNICVNNLSNNANILILTRGQNVDEQY